MTSPFDAKGDVVDGNGGISSATKHLGQVTDI